MFNNPLKPLQKTAALILLLLAGVQLSPARGEEPMPSLSLRKALDIAESARSARESGEKVYVVSISLEPTSLTSSRRVWTVKWSSPLIANNPQEREIGVEISMDGSVKRLVKSYRPAKSALHP